ncbi:NRPS-like enzyme, putative [Metarhizium acridum CQMa 102]|uniref:NRPS-like enzyme, putative n=2 Tax=Metarhizium acridum TaxID=92637 RepID=E9ED89_METAQ|nr:NRPS-like enzyme, putative [Metarhizium acridum CQMa 102]EFY86103.1 NRPS-like enzyme, putative [Metarhizium acridum CQMa 102]QBA81964.1 adenylate-forming reductase [Metarhizium acridum]
MNDSRKPHTMILPTRDFTHGEASYCPFPTVTAAFFHYAAAIPSAKAVRDLSANTERALTYRELAIHVQSLASRLRRMGVGPHQTVPLVVKRGAEMVIGILAILSCGAQYVPLDGGVVPDSTIKLVAEQCGGQNVVCITSTEDRIKKLLPTHSPIVVEQTPVEDQEYDAPESWVDLASADGGCYVIYTSAAWEIFSCLCNGGTLVLRGSKWEPTVRQLDVFICTPTILSKYHPKLYPNIKVVATAGEPTSQDLADLWATHATYWNCCGPTETTIVNTMSKHVAGDPISIGRPTPNNSVYILDNDGRPVPVGVAGVMWAGGHGVTRGYVGLESKTKETYIPDPFANDGVDDQVKVKGFRVELDGISSSLASAPGVTRATALLIEGEIHGFTTPSGQDEQSILAHTKKLQPYYAIPSKLHQLQIFPTTANGKIDKNALRLMALTPEPKHETQSYDEEAAIGSDQSTLAEVRSISTSSTLTEPEKHKLDISREIPEKKLPKHLRGFRHRIAIVYRFLFSLIGLLNVGALIALLLANPGAEWFATLTAANLVLAVLVRQDVVINTLYTVTCSLPKSAPLWMRKRFAKIYHLGGVHSGAGVCATAWLLGSTFRSTVAYTQNKTNDSIATLMVSWMLCVLCSGLVGFAYPTFRKKYHDQFEGIHRFVGWTALALFWVRTMFSVRDVTPAGEDFGLALVKTPGFWMLGVATCSVASSWLWLRKVPVNTVPLSDHAVVLSFDYTVPVNGSFTRISTRPLFEWHSFATIPAPKPSAIAEKPGYSLVVSNAGDWTKDCIRNPPTKLWVRGLPTCGVMRIATLFNRIVVIATGSGIGPLLGHIGQPSCPTQLIWSTPSPEKTFGKKVLDTIYDSIPDAVIHDTKKLGRPDLVKMGYNLAKDFGAEAVIIIANEKITKKVVYGLETRGVPAYGAIWDS